MSKHREDDSFPPLTTKEDKDEKVSSSVVVDAIEYAGVYTLHPWGELLTLFVNQQR